MSITTFKVKSDNLGILEHIASIALTNHKAVTHYRVTNNSLLELFWCASSSNKDAIPFLTPLTQPADVANTIRQWFTEGKVVYPEDQPDTDGDNVKGCQ